MEHKMTPVEYGEKNDFSTVRVPVDKRMSAYSITMVIVGLIIALSALYTGASFSEGLNLREMLIADLAGNVILCFYAGLMGIIGARENMSVTMLSRHSFGRIGSGLISAIVAISLSGCAISSDRRSTRCSPPQVCLQTRKLRQYGVGF